MQEMPQHESPKDTQPPRNPVRSIPLTAAALALLLALAFFFWFSHPSGPSTARREIHLTLGPAERAYASHIQVGNLALSRAENFLHQEVTTLSGDLTNAGDQPVLALELTVEFYDEMHQVVLRETRAVFSRSALPIAPGERRSFEISFEHIPSSWNMQPPAVRVTGLRLAPAKH
jgi:hypothetical protein